MLKRLHDLERIVLVLLMIGMVLVTFVQVVARYVFNSGATWALELTVFLYAWLVLLGAVHLAREGRHIGIDALISVLKPRGRKVAGVIAASACVYYALMMLQGGWTYFSKLYRLGIPTADLGVPTWCVLIVLPLAFAALAVRFGITLVRIVTGRADGMLSTLEDEELVAELDAAQATRKDAD